MPCALPPVDQSVGQLGWRDGTFLTDPYGPAAERRAPVQHDGWDFLADEGAPVLATLEGRVVHVGWQPYGGPGSRPGRDALGNYVVIEHPNADAWGHTLWSRYSHLRSASSLREGQTVRAGDLVGYVGTSGQRPGARRSRLYFQVVRPLEGSDRFDRGTSSNITDFFSRNGVTIVGGQSPGPAQDPYTQTPAWGGRLEQNSACAGGLGTARPGSGSGVQDPRYSRFGQTKLSRTDIYAPAMYAEDAVDSSFGALASYWLAWGLGTVGALVVLRRFVMPKLGLRGLGACPCDTNPNGRACRELSMRALKKARR